MDYPPEHRAKLEAEYAARRLEDARAEVDAAAAKRLYGRNRRERRIAAMRDRRK